MPIQREGHSLLWPSFQKLHPPVLIQMPTKQITVLLEKLTKGFEAQVHPDNFLPSPPLAIEIAQGLKMLPMAGRHSGSLP